MTQEALSCDGNNWGLFWASIVIAILLWNVWKTSPWYKPKGDQP